MTELDFSLDAEVRRAEPDLWLSSRLVSDLQSRRALIALYTLHVELSRVADAASNPLAGEIRLAWWREEVEALSASRPMGHPALIGLKGAPDLDLLALGDMIEARHAELETRPFNDETALLAYLDGVYGGLMRAASSLLSPAAALGQETARAWGWTMLLRRQSSWRARGRNWTPLSWVEASEAEVAAHVRHRVADALTAARGDLAALPVAVFPALAYVALAEHYARKQTLSDLEKRARLIWASARGKI